MKLKKILALMLSCLTLMLVLTSCGKSDKSSEEGKNKEDMIEKSFTVTLYPEHAPITCENFEKLVSEKFYDGLIFHRVVEGFMAQGGDPEGTGRGGAPETIKGEFKGNGVDNTLSHKRGVISMARSTENDSASSQFFICYNDVSSSLDGSYAAFGEVTDGMDVVDEFLKVERSVNSMGEIAIPIIDITIKKAEMIDDDADGNPRVKFTMNYKY